MYFMEDDTITVIEPPIQVQFLIFQIPVLLHKTIIGFLLELRIPAGAYSSSLENTEERKG